MVTTMEMCDVDDDGVMELVAGAEDNTLRVYKGDEMLYDMGEPGKIRQLSRIRQDTFAFALENGQIGVYQKKTKTWKIKHKQKVTALLGVDFNNDGKCDLVLGFENGRVEAREDVAGTILFKKNYASAISKLLYADFRMQGTMQVICCTTEGEIKGFSLVAQSRMEKSSTAEAASNAGAIGDLNREKQTLMSELSALAGDDTATKASCMQYIPKDIKVSCRIDLDIKKSPVFLFCSHHV